MIWHVSDFLLFATAVVAIVAVYREKIDSGD